MIRESSRALLFSIGMGIVCVAVAVTIGVLEYRHRQDRR